MPKTIHSYFSLLFDEKMGGVLVDLNQSAKGTEMTDSMKT